MTTSTQVSCLLVANRGEIARRVFRTCHDLGIATVAVFSDADAQSPHVAEADMAVRLPGTSPTGTYLRPGLLIDAALAAGADAIHPGYGFLSENAEFARAVAAAGLTWIGPPPEAIEAMGSKIESKRLMGQAGVPLLTDLDPATVSESDLPVLIKASAGGGGRGMRVVRSLDALPGELEGARSEAASAFGDPAVFCEPYVEAGRHIEVQVMADQHGTVWAVGERECSLQRRHQKVVEETPSPLVDAELRERLCTAATSAAKAIGYVGAGTVEFLATEEGRFFFLEMNTRLQVEHPVTECVTGLDLVGLQVRIAEGSKLDETPPQPRGHAIEVRLYAEDPAQDWQPQSGILHRFDVPTVDSEFIVPGKYGIRVDSGVHDGSAVSVHYDPMLAKIIAWSPDRAAAARVLARALATAKIHGLATNRDLLVRVLRHPEFLSGQTDTAFFDKHGLAALAEPLADKETEAISALAAALADAAANRQSAEIPSGWRNIVSQPQRKTYAGPSGEHEVSYRLTRSGLVTDGVDGVELVSSSPARVVLDLHGLRRVFEVARYGELVCVDSALGPVALTRKPRFPDPSEQVEPGSLLAPMPGSVVRIAVSAGDVVEAGQPLLWLEAMKMEHKITAPASGVVGELPVQVGQQVETGAVLAVVRSED